MTLGLHFSWRVRRELAGHPMPAVARVIDIHHQAAGTSCRLATEF
jgi:hypothetical protein